MQVANQEHTTHSKNTTKTFVAPTLITQKKLEIGESDDKYEVEADRMADQVVQMKPIAIDKPKPANNNIQRKCASCEEEEKIQKKALVEQVTPLIQKRETNLGGESVASQTITSGINQSRGRGKSLNGDVKHHMESGFGADFSSVRIHTDSNAINLSKQLNAQAFTVGNDIYFNEGKYNPNSNSGKHLLAHELTHTIQQQGVRKKKVQRVIDIEPPQRLNQANSSILGNETFNSMESVANNLLARDEVVSDQTILALMRLRGTYSVENESIDLSVEQFDRFRNLYQRAQRLAPTWANFPIIDFDQFTNSEPEVQIQRVAQAAPLVVVTVPVWLIPLLIIAIIVIIAILILLLLDTRRPVSPANEAEAERIVEEALREARETSRRPRPGPRPRPIEDPPPIPPRRRRLCYLMSLILRNNGNGTWTSSGVSPTPQDIRAQACLTRTAVGTSNRVFRQKNIAVGRFKVGNSFHLIATENPERNYHSEDELLRLAEARWGANGFLWDALFSERRPCFRCSRNIERYNTTDDFTVYCIVNNDYNWRSIKQHYGDGSIF